MYFFVLFVIQESLSCMTRHQKSVNHVVILGLISYLFITHNLSAARFMCDRIAVMYLGKIVELSNRTSLFENPSHPYTKALLPLCPTPNPEGKIEVVPLTGEVPSPINPPPGCRFHPRCPHSKDTCTHEEPELRGIESDHQVACHLRM